MKIFKKNIIINKYQKIIFFIIIILINKLQAQEFEFIAQHEGKSSAIGYFGNYIYFNSGGNINVLETGTNNEFTLVNSFNCGNSYCEGITISSNKMFLSAFDGVLIFDLNDPVNPDLMSIAGDCYPHPRYTIIKDTILIALAEDHAFLYNISNPYQPEYLSNINYVFNRNCTYALNNNILYGFHQAGYSGPQYLLGFEITDPENPYISVYLQLCPNFQGPWPDCMSSFNNNLFVAFNDTIKIYDISTTDTITYQTQFSVPNEISNLRLEDNLAYISVTNNGVLIFDITNLFEPELIGTYNQPEFIDEFEINNDHIYCALNNNGFRIADKSDLQNIQNVYEYIQTDAAYSVYIYNNLAYFGMKESGLQIVDISNILNPVRYGNIETLPKIEDIESIPNFLYCKKQSDSIIHIINISDSINPLKVGEIQAEHHWIADYCIDQNCLFLLDSLYYIEIYDLSTPESPVLLSSIQEHSAHIAVKDSLLILCEKIGSWPSPIESKLKLFSIEDNYSITLQDEIILGEYNTHRPFQMELDYPYIYIMARAGVIVLKIANNNLTICDEIILAGFSEDLAYDDLYIYLSGYFAGSSQIVIIDKSDPYNLTITQSISKYSMDLVHFGNNICFTAGTTGYYFYGQDFIGINEPSQIKNKFKISCYPNPCNQFTTIYFIIPENKKAKLTIYNLSGQKLIDYDITNKSELTMETNSFTPGIYLYKISANEISHINKLIVTR